MNSKFGVYTVWSSLFLTQLKDQKVIIDDQNEKLIMNQQQLSDQEKKSKMDCIKIIILIYVQLWDVR